MARPRHRQIHMEAAIPILMLVIAMVLFGAWHYGRAGSILETWARDNGYRILSQENCWLAKGPFFWTSTRGQEVYRITVRDREGRTRSGYVRCGGAFLGMLSDRVDVRWDA